MIQVTKSDNGEMRQVKHAIGYITAALLGFFLCVVISVLMLPEGLRANRGFSFYGDMAQTVALYRLAFLLCGAGMLLAMLSLPNRMPFTIIRAALWIIFPLLFGIVITTMPDNPPLARIHRGIGTTLFIVLFVLGAWLSLIRSRTPFSIAFFTLFFLGGLLSLLSILTIIPYLIQGQVLFLLMFGVVIVYALMETISIS